MVPASAATLVWVVTMLTEYHQPEMEAFAGACPQVGRLIRPLYRMVEMTPPAWLALPQRVRARRNRAVAPPPPLPSPASAGAGACGTDIAVAPPPPRLVRSAAQSPVKGEGVRRRRPRRWRRRRSSGRSGRESRSIRGRSGLPHTDTCCTGRAMITAHPRRSATGKDVPATAKELPAAERLESWEGGAGLLLLYHNNALRR